MAELLIRVGSADAAFLEGLLSDPHSPRPDRIVVDAHVPAATDRIGSAAQFAGIPYVIDPQTYYLQDIQDPSHPWPQLPFAHAEIMTSSDLRRPGIAERIAQSVIEYQVTNGATALVAPYVHIARAGDGWLPAQVALWKATRTVIDRHGLRLPVIAVVAVGWRLLDRAAWPQALRPLGTALRELVPTEVALAASNVDAGAHPEERVAAFISAMSWMSGSYPVVAWQQGVLGPAAVLAGAVGYECGLGWRERCDLQRAMTQLRDPRTDGGSARPIYSARLLRSIPRKTMLHLASQPRIAAELVCPDPACCPGGRQDLLSDPRAHALRSRRQTLHDITSPQLAAWQWHQLAQSAQDGLQLADRLNNVIARSPGVPRIQTTALTSTAAVATYQRDLHRRHRAA